MAGKDKTRKEEKDSLEKISKDIYKADTLLSSLHTRLVAFGTETIAKSRSQFYLRRAMVNLKSARGFIACEIRGDL